MIQMQTLYDYRHAQEEARRAEERRFNLIKNNFLALVLGVLLIIGSVWLHFFLVAKNEHVEAGHEGVFRNFRNSREAAESKAKIERNLKSIAQLKGELEKKDVDKVPILLEMRLVELENIWLRKKLEERELLAQGFETSDLYATLQGEKPIEKVNQEDLERLVDLIDMLYPSFRFRLSCIFRTQSFEDLCICYLLKARIRKIHIGSIIHISRQAINNRCKNMSEELFGHISTQKIFEQFIDSL
jgi:hypothetical protein